jgi:23S rRNA pseudouridine1911/1915/1917 synthase
MAEIPLTILFEDNHLLAVQKPAGLPTMGAKAGVPSLLAIAKDYIGRKYHKPGNVYLGVVSRLDALVTGVVILARTSKAAARLTEQFRRGEVEKVYWALVEGEVGPAEERCVDWLRKDDRQARMLITDAGHPDAEEARLTYRRLRTFGRTALVEVHLETGRKHQIRVQLAHCGHPILGDRKYGSHRSFPEGIALHAKELGLIHPVRKTPLQLTAPLPTSWQKYDLNDCPRRIE